jgi:hypothetical protein
MVRMTATGMQTPRPTFVPVHRSLSACVGLTVVLVCTDGGDDVELALPIVVVLEGWLEKMVLAQTSSAVESSAAREQLTFSFKT